MLYCFYCFSTFAIKREELKSFLFMEREGGGLRDFRGSVLGINKKKILIQNLMKPMKTQLKNYF